MEDAEIAQSCVEIANQKVLNIGTDKTAVKTTREQSRHHHFII